MSESIAILSDVHANLPALEAVLADIESQGIRELLCLGDVVGYGAQPAECIELLRAKDFVTILRGNHDAYAACEVDPPNVSPETLEGIRWTRARLSPEHRDWLGALPLTWQGQDYEAVHASLHRPDEWGYVLEPAAATQHFAHQLKPLCFIGHSHQPKMLVEGEDRALDITSLESIRQDRKQIINVGSVGQPRDKDERACYLIYRRDRLDVWWRRVAYDVSAAQSAIVAAGLPMKFAQRLSHGK
jgi:diadenosine tetraphosphatase ApaH/serine/threonine PP2A family protein phosphatase